MLGNCSAANTTQMLLDFSNPVKDRYLILITRSVKVYVFLPSPFPSFNKCYKELL